MIANSTCTGQNDQQELTLEKLEKILEVFRNSYTPIPLQPFFFYHPMVSDDVVLYGESVDMAIKQMYPSLFDPEKFMFWFLIFGKGD